MHKQLLLFHNAIAAYFSGNSAMLEATIKQFSVRKNVKISFSSISIECSFDFRSKVQTQQVDHGWRIKK